MLTVVGGRVAEHEEDPLSEAQWLGRVFLKGRERYKHGIVPVSQLISLTPVQASGRTLSACIKAVALLISCKQAKSSLGGKHKLWQGRRGESLLKYFCLLIITVIRPLVENLYLIKSLTSPRRYSRLLRPTGESLRLTHQPSIC